MQYLAERFIIRYTKWVVLMTCMMLFPPIGWSPADKLIARMRRYAFESLYRLDPMNPKNAKKHSLEAFSNQLTGQRSELIYGVDNMYLNNRKNRKRGKRQKTKRDAR